MAAVGRNAGTGGRADPMYQGLNEIGRLVASLEKKEKLNNTAPIYGVAQAESLGLRAALMKAKVSCEVKVHGSHVRRCSSSGHGHGPPPWARSTSM